MNQSQTLNSSSSIYNSLLKSIPILILSILMFMMYIKKEDLNWNITVIITLVFFYTIFFLITYTGKTDKYRAILFISLAIMFPLGFILRLYEIRGHYMILTFEDMLTNNAEFCLLGTTQNILPLIFKNEVFFPIKPVQVVGSIIGIFAIGLTVGRGFCGWACFWGGWEEGFSRIRKKTAIKKINPKLRWLPYAVLVSTAFLSAVLFTSFYCFWLCPFKTVSEFVELSTTLVIIQTVIFIALFIGLVVILPILTKKRTQCSFLCPFGALLSFFHKINPFEIRINKEKCINCNKCINICPVFAITESDMEKGKTNISCIRCAKCIDNCPENAIFYHIRGTKLFVKPELKKMLFLYPIFFLAMFIGAGAIHQFIYRIIIFITTGSFIN